MRTGSRGTPLRRHRNDLVLEPLEVRALLAASISGVAYLDRNSNGIQDAGEPPIPGATVYLDQNQNRTRDGGETFTTTDASGNYTFSGLVSGTYYVTQEPQSGYLPTSPLVPSASWTASGPAAITNGQVEGMTAQQNPVAGAIKAIVANPSDANTVYVGSVNGGIWKTTNGTSASPTWTSLTDQFPSLSIGSLKLDPTDATNQTLVAGIGKYSSNAEIGGPRSGLLKTTDGGATWSVLNNNLLGKNVSAVVPRGSTIVVAVDAADINSYSNVGIFRSIDGGATFSKLSSDSPSTLSAAGLPGGSSFDVVGDPGNNAIMYCAIRDAAGLNGIYKSSDTGATWTRVSNAAMQALNTDTGTNNTANIKIAVGNANNVYVGFINNNGQLSGLFRSGDGGANWTQLDTPVTNEGGTTVGIQPDKQPVNREKPWLGKPPKEHEHKLSRKKGKVSDFSGKGEAGGQGIIHFSILADRTNANLVYVGGDRQPSQFSGGTETGVWPNSIGATNFSGRLFRVDASLPLGSQATALTNSPSTISNSSPHADSRAMTFDAAGNILEGDDGGIFKRSAPAGTGDWTSLNGNLQVSEVVSLDYDHNAHRISAGFQDVGRAMSPSSGNVWNTFSQGDGGVVWVDDSSAGSSIRYSTYTFLQDLRRDTIDSSGNVVSSAPVQLVVSGTGGLKLSQWDPNVQFYNPYVVNRVDPTRMAIGTADVYTSTNRGDAINDLGFLGAFVTSLDYGGTQNGIDNPDALYVGTTSSGGGVTSFWAKTSSGGALTQRTSYPGGNVSAVMMDPTNWARVFVLDASHLWMSPDSGTTWSNLTGALSDGVLRSLAFVPGANALVVGGTAGVFLTSMGSPGTSWSEVGDLPNAPITDLRYDASADVLVAGTLGRGAWTIGSVTSALTNFAAERTVNLASANVTAQSFGDFPTLFNGSANNDQYTLSLQPGGTTTQIQETLGASPVVTYTIPATTLGLNPLTFHTGALNDSLNVDFANGNPIPGSITFDGGADSDTLTLSTTAGADTVTLNNAFIGGLGTPIHHSNLEAITFDGRGGNDDVTINGGPAVTFPATQQFNSLTINGGSATLAANGSRLINTDTLSIAPTATLDLKDNDMIVRSGVLGTWNGSDYDGLTGLIRQGRNGGSWNGNGIVTSQSAALATRGRTTLGIATAADVLNIDAAATALWQGQSVTGSAVLIKYTYVGDAHLDGAVNGDDFASIDAGFSGSATGFFNGDWDYSGKVNADDYFWIDQTYPTQGAVL